MANGAQIRYFILGCLICFYTIGLSVKLLVFVIMATQLTRLMFFIIYGNLYQQPGLRNLIGCNLEVDVAS